MNYQNVTLRLSPLSNEAAASLYKFIEVLMHAIDDQYYKQIHCHYADQLKEMMKDYEEL